MFDWIANPLAGLFANPWAFLAGVGLVSVPLIIHLINRLRFKRVQWAAMEFLLKAQKRIRRKMVIQQLLLLLLRCLFVILVGLLVARFLGFDFLEPESRSTTHIVILDDTPSMADGWSREDGTATTSFDEAKRVLVEQLAKSAAEATTKQRLEVYRLSDLANPVVIDRLSDATIRKYDEDSRNLQPGLVRVPPLDGLRAAQASLAQQPGDVAKIVHVLSDFRSTDWAEASDAFKDVAGQLASAKVKLNLIDVAHPFRKVEERRAPVAHDNVAITELTPNKLVVARYDQLEFTLRVRNFGAAEVKGLRFAVKVNGDENKGRSVAIDTLPGNQERTVKFDVAFDRVATEGKPLDRFSLVSVALEPPGEPGGLKSDNVRHAVVEVRERLPILVVDGRPASRDSKDGDGFYLKPVFTTVFGGYSWNPGTARDLESADLSRYVFVLVLNVPSLTEPAVKNLEQYARLGGGVGFFLGPDVRPKEYNDALYRDGAGIMPVPLADQPSPELSEEELNLRRYRISQKKLLIRDPARRGHPALAGVYTDERGEPSKDADALERVFGFISMKRHWPVRGVGAWRADKSVTELFCLPNDQAMADFEAPVRKVADALPVGDPEFARYQELLTKAKAELRTTANSSDPLYRLSVQLDDLLADQRSSGDPNEALLRELWANPKLAELKTEVARLRDAVKFGDPLYLAKEFGRGRVTLMTTTAGETWTDWPSQPPGSASFVPFMKEMGTYLSGAGTGENRTLGTPVEIAVEAGRYKPTAKKAFLSLLPAAGAGQEPVSLVDRGEQPLEAEKDKLILRDAETAQPGAHLYTLTQLKPTGTGAEATETADYRAAAVNLDAVREGDLRRATRDDILALAPGAMLRSAGDPAWVKELRNKTSDLSESWYLVVLLGLVLLAEQAMATKLSFTGAADVAR